MSDTPNQSAGASRAAGHLPAGASQRGQGSSERPSPGAVSPCARDAMQHLQKYQGPERLSPVFALDVKADAQGVVEGLASPFGGPPDSYGDTIALGAFRESLEEHRAAGTSPAMLWQHSTDQPLGVWTDLEERADGLHVRGVLNLKTEKGREAHALLKQGALNGLSIGFAIREGGFRRLEGGGRELTGVDLWEVSLVTFPAARRARVTGVKSAADVQSRADLERFLKNCGFANRLAKSISRDGWTDKTPNSSPEDLAAIVAELRASAARFMKG